MAGRVRRLDVGALYEWCDELIMSYAGRDHLYDRLDRLYFQEREVEGESEEEGVQWVTLPLATNVVDLVVDLAGAQAVRLSVPAAGEAARAKREAEGIERWMRAWLRASERRAGRGGYVSQMAWYAAMRGMVVVRVLPVIENGVVDERLPMLLQVRDPRQVYVEWGPLGIRCVVEERERTVRGVRWEYGESVLRGRKDEERIRWREYWDKRRVVYWADGEVVPVAGRGVREHGYGGIPYGIAYGRLAPVADMGRALRPLLAGVERVIENVEVLASILATAGVQTVTSAFAVYSQRHGVGENQVALDVRPGAVNYFDPTLGERVEPIQRPALPADVYRLMELFLGQFQQGTFPVALFGEVGREMAGYAINLLTQSGRRALLPVWRAIERGHEEGVICAARLAASLVGPAYGGPLPLVYVEEGEGRRRYRRDLLLEWERLGEDFDVECRLGDPMPADRAANLRMALEAWRGGLLSQETVLNEFGIVDDALGEMERIFVERVVAQGIAGEAQRLAEERGYLPRVREEAESERLARLGVVAGDARPVEGGSVVGSGGIDRMQALAGMPEALPELGEMAGEPPVVR